MDPISAVFAVGTFWFWFLLVVELFVIFAFVDCDNGIAATISLVVFASVLQFFGNVNIVGFVLRHPIQMVGLFVAYFSLGLMWGIFKWQRLVSDRLRKYKERFSIFLQQKGLPEDTKVLPDQYRIEWKRVVDDTSNYTTNHRTIADVPLVRHYKATIMRWISLWVISVCIFMFKDMIVEMTLFLYERVAGFMQRIANNRWEKESDLKESLKLSDKKTN